MYTLTEVTAGDGLNRRLGALYRKPHELSGELTMNGERFYPSSIQQGRTVSGETQESRSHATTTTQAMQYEDAWNLSTLCNVASFTHPSLTSGSTDTSFTETHVTNHPVQNAAESESEYPPKLIFGSERQEVKDGLSDALVDQTDYCAQFDTDGDSLLNFQPDHSKPGGAADLNRRGDLDSLAEPKSNCPPSGPDTPLKNTDFGDGGTFHQPLSNDGTLFESADTQKRASKDRLIDPDDHSHRTGLGLYLHYWGSDKAESALKLDLSRESNSRPSCRGYCDVDGNHDFDSDNFACLPDVAINTDRATTDFVPHELGSGYKDSWASDSPNECREAVDQGPDALDGEAGQQTSAIDGVTSGAEIRLFNQKSARKRRISRSTLSTKPHIENEMVKRRMTEKKYRTNMNDKIAELRDTIPVLRHTQDAKLDNGSSAQLEGSMKVTKGGVLTKATQYIQHLEQKVEDILAENQYLSQRLQGYESLFHGAGRGG